MIKRRTDGEIDFAVNKLKDYTGGYDFLNWVIFMKEGRTKAFFSTLLLIGGICITAFTKNTYNLTVQIWVGVIGIIAGLFLWFLTVRQFKQMKKGISR